MMRGVVYVVIVCVILSVANKPVLSCIVTFCLRRCWFGHSKQLYQLSGIESKPQSAPISRSYLAWHCYNLSPNIVPFLMLVLTLFGDFSAFVTCRSAPHQSLRTTSWRAQWLCGLRRTRPNAAPLLWVAISAEWSRRTPLLSIRSNISPTSDQWSR